MVKETRQTQFRGIDETFRADSREDRAIRRQGTLDHHSQEPATREKPLVINPNVRDVLLEMSEGETQRNAIRHVTENSEAKRKVEDEIKSYEEQLRAKRITPKDYDGHALLLRAAIRSGVIPRLTSPVRLEDLSQNQQQMIELLARGFSKERLLQELKEAGIAESTQGWARMRRELAENVLKAKSTDNLTPYA